MPSPDFIISGASKSGTTSLHHYLSEHDDIFMAESATGAELHFFEKDPEYDKGIEYYESHFDAATDETVLGEKTPAYFRKGTVWAGPSSEDYIWQPADDAPRRIHDHYPDIKLIFSLRNPITRAYSQYWKNYRQGHETAPSFYQALTEELQGERDSRETQYCWIFQNRYSTHLERWLELFEREQMKVLIFERWIEDPEPVLNEICRFLGVDTRERWNRADDVRNVGGEPRFVILNRIYQRFFEGTPVDSMLSNTGITHLVDELNSSPGYPEMSDDAWELAADVFLDEIDATEDVLDVDLDIWRREIVRERPE